MQSLSYSSFVTHQRTEASISTRTSKHLLFFFFVFLFLFYTLPFLSTVNPFIRLPVNKPLQEKKK